MNDDALEYMKAVYLSGGPENVRSTHGYLYPAGQPIPKLEGNPMNDALPLEETKPRSIIVKLDASFAFVGAKKARTHNLVCVLPEHEARKIFQMVEAIIAGARRDSK